MYFLTELNYSFISFFVTNLFRNCSLKQIIKIENSKPSVKVVSPPYQSDYIQQFSRIIDNKAYKSLSELEIDIIAHVAKQQCITSLEQDPPTSKESVDQTIQALEIEHIINESESLQWENKWDEIKQAILEKQMPNINSNMQFEVLRNNVNLGKVSDMIKRYLKKRWTLVHPILFYLCVS